LNFIGLMQKALTNLWCLHERRQNMPFLVETPKTISEVRKPYLKKKQYRYLRLLPVLLFWLSVVACSDCEPVLSNGNTLVVSYFDSIPYNANFQLTPKKVRYDSIFTLQKADTLPLSQVLSNDSAELRIPLPLLGDTVVYIMASSDTLAGTDPPVVSIRYDTLSVGFDRQTVVSTPDCGVAEDYVNIRVGAPTSFVYELSVNFIDPNVDQNILIFH